MTAPTILLSLVALLALWRWGEAAQRAEHWRLRAHRQVDILQTMVDAANAEAEREKFRRELLDDDGRGD